MPHVLLVAFNFSRLNVNVNAIVCAEYDKHSWLF